MNAELLAQAKAQIEALTATLNKMQKLPGYEENFALDLAIYVTELEELAEYCEPSAFEEDDE